VGQRTVLAAAAVAVSLGIPASPALADVPSDIAAMVRLAAQDDDAAALPVTLRLAAKAAPGEEAALLAIVAETAPARAGDAAAALGLRPRTAEAAVAAAGGQDTQETAAAVTEAQEPRVLSFEGWRGKARLGGSRSTGNTEEETLAAGIDVARQHGRWSYEFDLALDIQTDEGETTKNRFEAGAKANYAISERLYSFALTDYVDDDFDGFEYRVTAGAGLGWRILTGERAQWRVEAGPGVQIDEPELGDGDISFAGLFNSRFSLRLGEATFRNDTDVTVADGTTVKNITALEMPVWESLSGILSYEVRYRSDAPPGTEDTDTVTKASLAYTFGQ